MWQKQTRRAPASSFCAALPPQHLEEGEQVLSENPIRGREEQPPHPGMFCIVLAGAAFRKRATQTGNCPYPKLSRDRGLHPGCKGVAAFPDPSQGGVQATLSPDLFPRVSILLAQGRRSAIASLETVSSTQMFSPCSCPELGHLC